MELWCLNNNFTFKEILCKDLMLTVMLIRMFVPLATSCKGAKRVKHSSRFNISGISPVYTEDSWMEKIASKCLYEAPNSIVSLMFNSTPTSMYNKRLTSLVALHSWSGEAVCRLVVQT